MCVCVRVCVLGEGDGWLGAALRCVRCWGCCAGGAWVAAAALSRNARNPSTTKPSSTSKKTRAHNNNNKAASVEALGAKLGFTADAGRYAAVSLGQGQEPVAMAALEAAHRGGGWVLLQNVHLTIDWTSGPLEKRVDKLAGARARVGVWVCLCARVHDVRFVFL